MKELLGQGRTAEQMRAHEDMADFIAFWIIRLACAVVICVAIFGCAEPRVYVENGTRFHESDTSKCIDRRPACTVAGEVYYFTLPDKYHEIDHINGLTHSEPSFSVAGYSRWTFERGNDSCVKILTNGNTKWHAGNLLCRHFDNGEYYERKPS